MAYDQSIIDEILRRGSQVTDPSARNRYIRAALQTGIVESGLQNLNHGDADSLGWRQERASLYSNPTNVRASVNRFFEEAAKLDRGQASWQLAADVQRPAEQYRGRYKDVAKQAAALLGGGVPASSGSSGSAPQPSASGGPQVVNGGQGGDFTGILAALLKPQGQPQAQASTLAPAAFAAAPAMPKGFAPAPIIASPSPRQGSNVSQALSLVEALGGSGPSVGSSGGSGGAESPGIADAVAAERQAGPRIAGLTPLGGSKNAGNGSFEVSGPNPGRLKKELVSFADRVASVLGAPLVGLDGSTHSKFTVNGNVSEHYSGNATDVFQIGGLKYGDKGWQQELVRAGRAALIAAGMPRAKALKQTGGLFNVGSHQIIFNVDGKQYGGNHLDHLHISAR